MPWIGALRRLSSRALISEDLEQLIAARLGNPTVDPTATRSRCGVEIDEAIPAA